MEKNVVLRKAESRKNVLGQEEQGFEHQGEMTTILITYKYK